MKLKKGSKAAKDFMAKIRARKGKVSGWKKGNTQILEVGEKPKIKNVRVKRTKAGTFINFRKYLGSVTSDNAKQLILNNIDSSGYDEKVITPTEKIRFIEKIFLIEQGYLINRLGKQKAIEEWLRGLPSALTLPFYNYDILNIAKEWGTLKENATERQEDKILMNYWKLMSSQLLQMINKRKLNKKFY